MVERTIGASREKILSILADGWTYSDWVVGTAHIRNVDRSWPEPGARIHHQSGPWPLRLHDVTRVLEYHHPSQLILRARLWPMGHLRIHIDMASVTESSTKVVLREEFEDGPMLWLRTKINDLLLHWRNVESLRRLDDLAARRQVRNSV